jgi:hypothetical protein
MFKLVRMIFDKEHLPTHVKLAYVGDAVRPNSDLGNAGLCLSYAHLSYALLNSWYLDLPYAGV